MTDDDLVRVFTRVRDELPPPISPVASTAARGVGDKRRRTRTAMLAVAGVAAAAAVISLAPRSADPSDGAGPSSTSSATEENGLEYTLPDGWVELGSPDERTTCVGPADTPADNPCPVEIVVADDPTVVSPSSRGITDVTDRCEKGEVKRLMTVEPSRNLPVVIFKGGCGSKPPTTTVVALDSGTVFVRSQDPDSQHELEALVSTFVIPRSWFDPGDLSSAIETPSVEPTPVPEPRSSSGRQTDPFLGMTLATDDFPVTGDGLTYGSDSRANSAEQAPDLIAVVATNGRGGFVRKAVLWGNQGVTNPEEAARYEEGIANGWQPAPAPVWDLDGNKVGVFKFVG